MKKFVGLLVIASALFVSGCGDPRRVGSVVIYHQGAMANRSTVIETYPPPPVSPGNHGGGMYYDRFYYNN